MTLIHKAIIRLFEKERFYAELIAQMRRISNPTLPVVAGICIKDYIELHINEEKFKVLTLDEQVAILRHECEHILRDHIPRSKELMPEVYEKCKDQAENIVNKLKHTVFNIAADCAINGNIANLPDWGCFPKTFDLPPGQTMEWYFNNLKNNENIKNMIGIDNHDLWKNSEGAKEFIRQKIKDAINSAAQKTRAAGRLPGDLELLISKLNESQIDWRCELSRFVARSLEIQVEQSRKRRNRRYGMEHPGNIKVERLHIGVAIDTSGSISDRVLTQFLTEIEKISKYSKVTIVEADSEVKAAYDFKKSKCYKISGRGGTAYQPALDYFNNINDIDAVIYFGDMDSSDKPKKPKYPVLWAIVGNSEPPGKFGKKIKITLKSEE